MHQELSEFACLSLLMNVIFHVKNLLTVLMKTDRKISVKKQSAELGIPLAQYIQWGEVTMSRYLVSEVQTFHSVEKRINSESVGFLFNWINTGL